MRRREPSPRLHASRWLSAALAASALLAAPGARAAARPRAHALIVGSDAGGAGQGALRFAEDDARQVAEVLREIGHYDAADVRLLEHPGAPQVVAALDDLAAQVRADAARGEQAEVFFYYSGHARADAVDLGGDELPLSELRARLGALPAALTIVVLDACQSGAFARVKGAEPAADFSYDSVSKLTQKGLAIMASSSRQELSQESDELRGSYFTHHLLTALRGAGDSDGDGRVSLDEAYRYAYRRTLASTARTQVGEQHVTLETDLAGQGEVPVTYPAEARAQLELPAALEGRVLVQHRASGSVLAEVQKAAGAAVRIAAPSGAYDAIVGLKTGVVECSLSLDDDRVTPLDAAACAPVAPDRTQAKGDDGRPWREIDRWAIEGSFGAITRGSSAFTDRLGVFGYSDELDLVPALKITLAASRVLVPHVAAVVQVGTLSSDTYLRSIGAETDTASLRAYGAGAYVRTWADLGSWLGVYGEAGGGVSLGLLTYTTQQTGVPPSTTSAYAGYLLGGAVGVTFRLRRVPLTFFVQGGYDTAPAIRDLIGDTHDSGGFSAAAGARLRLGDGR